MKLNYNDVFGIEMALAELLEQSMPINLALNVADLYEEIASYKRKGLKALGKDNSEARINELAVQEVEISHAGLPKKELTSSLSEIKPITLLKLNKVLI